MTVTVSITGLEPVAVAINNLAKAMGSPGGVVAALQDKTEKSTPVQQAAPALPPAPTPVQQAPAPVPQAPAVQQAVPTSAPSYTPDDLAKAAISLMDAGRQNDLVALLQQFGVNSVPSLRPEQYGPFATALRAMGAQI